MGCCGSASRPSATNGKQAPKKDGQSESDGLVNSSQPEDAKKRDIANNALYEEKILFLGKVPLLRRLKRDQHPILASMMNQREYKQGETVIKQGDRGDEFFIIRKGEASVNEQSSPSQASRKLCTLKERDYFGEQSLLREEPRSATVIAETKLSVFTIKQEKFQAMNLHTKLNFPSRRAVLHGGSEVAEDDQGTHRRKPARETAKTDQEKQFIIKALKANDHLQTFVAAGEKQWEEIADAAWKQTVEPGTVIINAGDKHCDKFYIIQEGEIESIENEEFDLDFDATLTNAFSRSGSVAPTAGGTRTGSKSFTDSRTGSKSFGAVKSFRQKTKTYGAGGSFGELALLYLSPSIVTVKALQKTVVWTVDRITFKNILIQASDAQLTEYSGYLDKVEILSNLMEDEKKEVAKVLYEMNFFPGEELFLEGATGNSLFILYDGEVEVLKEDVQVATLQGSQSSIQCFGEKALLDNEVRTATVKVISDKGKVLVLQRSDFETLLGPLRDIVSSKTKQRKSKVDRSRRTTNHSRTTRRAEDKVEFKNLSRVGLLGSGGFGWVELWENSSTGETYALKAVGKGLIVEMGMQNDIINEKNIMLMTDSRFLIKLYETYADPEYLYFLMEPGLGGELFYIYNKHKFHGSETHARYYVAGTALAFFHLHERHIIYRDLKPENLLIDHHGHMKLTDMGLAKFCIGKTYTACGTPDYFAPEVICSTGHTQAVDWWCLGIFIFELMHGSPPFEAADPMDTYAKAMKGIDLIPMPAKLSVKGVELIKSLLKKMPSERLPMRPDGYNLLKRAGWFQDVDWVQLESGTFPPPYRPEVKSKKDLSNFRSKAKKPDFSKYVDDGSGWELEFASGS